MGQNQRISQLQEKNTILRDGDLFYVSEKQKYGDYISKHISYGKTIESVRSSLSDEIDLINDINENYLDDRQVEFTFNREQNTLEFNTGLQILSVDVSDFIESGMIKEVKYEKPNLIIIFKLSTGGTKTVTIDISNILILEEGYAIKIDGKKISVKPEELSSGLHLDDYSLTSHNHDNKYVKLNDSEYKNKSYAEISSGINLSDYSKIDHTHVVNQITDLTNNYYNKTECENNFLTSKTFIPTKTGDLVNDVNFVSPEDFGLKYSQADSKLSLTIGKDTTLTAEIQSGGTGGKTYTAGRGIVLSGENNTVINTAEAYTTYENVKNNLSSDGYSLKTIFRIWSE